MEGLFFVIAAIAALVLVFSGIVSLVIALGLRERLQRLEKRLETLGDISGISGMNAAAAQLARRISALEAAPLESAAKPAASVDVQQTQAFAPAENAAAPSGQPLDTLAPGNATPSPLASPWAKAAESATLVGAPAPLSEAAVEASAAEVAAPPGIGADPVAATASPGQREAAKSAAPATAVKAVKPKRDFEARFGTQWTVWVGAVALALGAIFLVRYSIEQGYFGPLGRIISGVLLALALLGAGEWLRRRDAAYALPVLPQAPVPALLTAAGTIAAFATVYAAHALYGMVGPVLAFALLGLVAIMAMLGSAIHGPSLAALGLAGSLAVPMLVQSQRSEGWALIGYLAVTAGAAYAVSYWRQWRWLCIAAAAGIAIWTLLIEAKYGGFALRLHVVIQTALAAAFLVVLPHRKSDSSVEPDKLASLALGGAAFFGLAASVIWGSFSQAWAALFLSAQLALALIFVTVAPAAVFAGAMAAGTLLFWPAQDQNLPVNTQRLLEQYGEHGVFLLIGLQPGQPAAFLIFAGIASAAVLAVCLFRLWRGAALHVHSAGFYVLAAIATPLLSLLIAWARLEALTISYRFAALTALLGLGFAALSLQFIRRGEQTGSVRLTAEAFAIGAILAAALALTMALNRGGLTVAFALTAAAAAYIVARSPLNLPRYAIGVLGAIVLARTARDPALLRDDVGGTPVLNWLLFNYGVPAVSFFFAGRWIGRIRQDWPVQVLQALSILFTALLVVFEIRHWFHSGDILAETTSHFELGLHVTVSLAMAAALTRLDTFNRSLIFRYGSMAIGAASTVTALLGLLLAQNPLLADGALVKGIALFNTLLPGYALPAAGAFALAYFAKGRRGDWFVDAALALGAVLAFTFVTLEIRHAFEGADISLGRLGLSETGLIVCAALLFALAAAEAVRFLDKSLVGRFGPHLFFGFAALLALFGLLLGGNPLFGGEVLGNAIFNSLIPAYLLPSVAAILIGRFGSLPDRLTKACLGLGAVLAFAFLNLGVRRIFQGPDMQLFKGFDDPELWTYSALWLGGGVLLLGLGIFRQSPLLRRLSAALVALTVLKVFLIDMRGLTGVWRALSFIGLGGALMGIGLAYQRLVFAARKGGDGNPA